MVLLDFVVAAYAPWLLVFSLHVWLFQSVEDDRESAHRRLKLDIGEFAGAELGGSKASEQQQLIWQKTRDEINANATASIRTFFVQLVIVTLGILMVLSVAEILPPIAVAMMVALVFVAMVFLLYLAVNYRHKIRSVSLGV